MSDIIIKKLRERYEALKSDEASRYAPCPLIDLLSETLLYLELHEAREVQQHEFIREEIRRTAETLRREMKVRR